MIRFFFLAFLCVLTQIAFVQNTNEVFSDDFSNKNGGWTTGSLIEVKDGSLKIIPVGDDISVAIPEKWNELLKTGLNNYEFEYKFKFNTIQDGGRFGLYLADNSSGNIFKFNGILFSVSLYEGEYYFAIDNFNLETPYNYFAKKLENFDSSRDHIIKISIDNQNIKTTVKLNNNEVCDLAMPLFTFNEMSFMTINDPAIEVDYITYNHSADNKNTSTMFDAIDRNESKVLNKLVLMRGAYALDKFKEYLPEVLFYDDWFISNSSLDRNDIQKALIMDDKSNISKKSYEKYPNKIFYIIDYKKSNIVLTCSEESDKLISAVIRFETKETANEFFKFYTNLKKFNNIRMEGGTRYAQHDLFFSKFISVEGKTLSFLFI